MDIGLHCIVVFGLIDRLCNVFPLYQIGLELIYFLNISASMVSSGGRMAPLVRVARLQNEVGTIFFELRNFVSQEKKHKYQLLGPGDCRVGWHWGSGVVVEKFVPSLESMFSLGFVGRNLGCPAPLGVFKVCAKKTLTFLGPETAWWGGGLPREGVVVKIKNPTVESQHFSKQRM